MGKALPSAANAGNAAIGNIANSNIRNRLKGNASMMASTCQSIHGSGLSDNELPYWGMHAKGDVLPRQICLQMKKPACAGLTTPSE